MFKRVLSVMIIINFFALPVFSQVEGNFPDITKDDQNRSGFSLLDPGKFKMSHSYSFMYTSSNYGSQSLGLYLNSIEYQISNPLKIRLNLGYYHNPGALIGKNNGSLSSNGQILPGLSITWKPSDKFHLHFNYQEMPGYYYNPYDRHDSNYWWYPETGRGY